MSRFLANKCSCHLNFGTQLGLSFLVKRFIVNFVIIFYTAGPAL